MSVPETGVGPGAATSSGSARNLRIAVVALAVVAIVLLATTAYLYMQAYGPQAAPGQPRLVRLISPVQISETVGGNWTLLKGSSLNGSNSAGFLENELLEKQGAYPQIVIEVNVNGFNSTADADFEYQFGQIFPGGHNLTKSGSFSATEEYTLTGTCNEEQACSVVEGNAKSSLYVVRIYMELPTVDLLALKSTVVNATAVEDLLRLQLAQMP